MSTQPHLFHELDFTKENVLTWAEERVLDEPMIRVGGNDVANSVENVLRTVLSDHYGHEWLDYDKGDLIEELRSYLMDGIDKPINTLGTEELLAEIMEVCGEAYGFKTMDNFLRCFQQWS